MHEFVTLSLIERLGSDARRLFLRIVSELKNFFYSIFNVLDLIHCMSLLIQYCYDSVICCGRLSVLDVCLMCQCYPRSSVCFQVKTRVLDRYVRLIFFESAKVYSPSVLHEAST